MSRLKKMIHTMGRNRLPQVDGRIYINQLESNVTIQRDRWGIPHITTQSRHDLFFTQGFVHAQDRFWQMELNRRAAKGELSAIFGAITLDADRLSRTFGFARLAQATLGALDAQATNDLAAYTAGVNALLNSQSHLPIEFSLVQFTPQPWEMFDSIAYAHLQMWALTHGAFGELVKAQLLQQADPALVNDLLMSYPDNFPTTLPDGIEENAQWIDAWRGTAVPWHNPFHGKGNLDGAGRGSNGWVIAPEHSQSNAAILCNDMHLPVGAPSIWHYQHLRSDTIHATGFTQPGIPYVMVGHNGRIAWGATLAYTDCEDIFLEKLHPDDPALYQFGNEWRPLEQHEEKIEIRFQKPHNEIISCTHHGPLIQNLLNDSEQPIAFSSTALRGGVQVDGFGWLNTAVNWDEFVTAVSRIHAPSLNLLYADRKGNIGHWVSGQVPIRIAGNGDHLADGSLPLPGWDGKHEWVGTVPFSEMPHALNPKSGFIISANNRLLNPKNSNHNFGEMWRNGYRAERIHQLLHSQEKFTVADCRKFHSDQLSLPGLQLVQILDGFKTAVPEAQLPLTLLREWDGQLTEASAGGAIFEVLIAQFTKALLTDKLPDSLITPLLGDGIHENIHPINEFQGHWLPNLLKILADKRSPWFDTVTMRSSLIERCLLQTTAVLKEKLGDDPTKWQWGHLHKHIFQHALGRVPPLDQIFNLGPLPLGGDGNTLAQAGTRPGSFTSDSIAVSSRLIIDMNAIDKGEAMLAPGQSGHLSSPHYSDLVEMWRQGENFPILWHEEDVLAATQHTLNLIRPSDEEPYE